MKRFTEPSRDRRSPAELQGPRVIPISFEIDQSSPYRATIRRHK